MEEKVRLFNIYKKDSKEWEIPRDQISKDFAVELVIHFLTDTFKKVRYVKPNSSDDIV